MNTNKEILKICMQKGFLLDRNILEPLSLLEEQLARRLLNCFFSLNLNERVVTKQSFIDHCPILLRLLENGADAPLAKNFLTSLGAIECDFSPKSLPNIEKQEINSSVKILFSPTIIPKKISVQDFVGHFRSRYEHIKSILLDKNLENLKSLRRIGKDRENYYVIVSILEKRITKNGNIILSVEDLNGQATILINNNKKELFDKAKDILLDEVIAIGVSGNNEMLFANDLVYPDAILLEKKKAEKEEIVAITSDLHVGSTMFFEQNFLKFINWLNGQEGDEDQKEIARKVKYLLIIGDSVDGVGVYPDQEKFLLINDMTKQYDKLVELLSKIRKDIEIIISPGQHDAVWVGEPQPAIDQKWAPELCKMTNVTLVTNPSVIEIGGCFKVLMYHGASMHGIIEEIEEIRTKYGHRSPTRVVKEMLKRRHLAPIHGSCDYIPNEKQDLMVMDILPDIICTGDQHKTEISSYNNILLVSSSCWQAKTPFEEKVGHEPDPCKVPIFNLKTREVKILDFSSE
jgi:DNA polymerase II small subunit